MLLINKYSPTITKKSYFHEEIYDLLKRMSKDNCVPHIIFSGPPGSGKKTMLNLFLEMLFDDDIYQTENVSYEITNSSGKVKKEIFKQSHHHIVIEPSSTNFDRYIIHDVIKKYACQMNFDVYKTYRPFKCIQINNLNMLSYYAQTALRRMMEKYSETCKFIMWSSSLSKIIKPLRSRCILIRVYRPNNSNMFKYLIDVCGNEQIYIPIKDYINIENKANGDIKKALWQIDMIKYNINQNMYYDDCINTIVAILFNKNINYHKIEQLKSHTNNIMKTTINMSNTMIDILDKIISSSKLNDKKKNKLILESVNINVNISNARREIFHFESFYYLIINTLAD